MAWVTEGTFESTFDVDTGTGTNRFLNRYLASGKTFVSNSETDCLFILQYPWDAGNSASNPDSLVTIGFPYKYVFVVATKNNKDKLASFNLSSYMDSGDVTVIFRGEETGDAPTMTHTTLQGGSVNSQRWYFNDITFLRDAVPDDLGEPNSYIIARAFIPGSVTTWFEGRKYTALFSSTIPVFNKISDALDYINTGNTKNAIDTEPIDLRTNWKVYIDGTKNPTYYISWDAPNFSAKRDKNQLLVDVMYAKFDGDVTDIPSAGTGAVTIPPKYYIEEHNDTKYTTTYTCSFDEVNNIVNPDTWIPDFIENLFAPDPVAIILRLRYEANALFYSTPIYFVPTYSGSGINDLVLYHGVAKSIDNQLLFVENDETIWLEMENDGSTITFNLGIPDPEADPDFYKNDEDPPGDDDDYDGDGDDDIDPDDDNDPVACGVGVLTSTFKMTEQRLKSLGHFLWAGNIYSDFDLINNNPIENIISVKAIPFNIEGGTTSEIYLANVNTGVNGDKINANFKAIEIGTVTIAKKYNSFLDYSPYTTVTIYLPYVGFKELNASDVMGKTIKVTYLIDVVTGGCLVQLTVGKVKVYEFTGSVGVDIPITASNRAQVEASYLASAATTVVETVTTLGTTHLLKAGSEMAGAFADAAKLKAGSNIFSNVLDAANNQYHFSTQGCPNPSCISSANRTCYIVIDRPTADSVKGFGHSIGYKCNLVKTLGKLKGFTVTTDNVELKGITCTQNEKEEIRQLLSSGVFL